MAMQKRKAKPEDLVPLNVRIDRELLRELRLRSVNRRADEVLPWEIQGIVAEAVRDWLKRNKR